MLNRLIRNALKEQDIFSTFQHFNLLGLLTFSTFQHFQHFNISTLKIPNQSLSPPSPPPSPYPSPSLSPSISLSLSLSLSLSPLPNAYRMSQGVSHNQSKPEGGETIRQPVHEIATYSNLYQFIAIYNNLN